MYVLLGSFNAAGNIPVEDIDWGTHGDIHLFNASGQWENAIEPLNRYSNIRKPGDSLGLGPASAFAKALHTASSAASEYEGGGRPIGLVVNARKGGSIRSWLPLDQQAECEVAVDGSTECSASLTDQDRAVDRYANTLQRIQDAVSEGVGHHLKGIVILAGEDDLAATNCSPCSTLGLLAAVENRFESA